MPKFNLEDRTTELVQVEVYEVEADTEEEAMDKYCNELAGAIQPINSYMRGPLSEDEEQIAVV